MEKTLAKKRFFSNRDLFSLFLPLIIEQGLEYTVGMAASMMVAQVGESAVSGVSLVDFVMALIIRFILSSAIVLLLMPLIMHVYNISAEATSMTWACSFDDFLQNCVVLCICNRISYGYARHLGGYVCRLGGKISDLRMAL